MTRSMLECASTAGSAVGDNTTRYFSPMGVLGNSPIQNSSYLNIRTQGFVSMLKTYVGANTTLVNSTITLQKNGVDTSITITYTSGQTGEKNDIANVEALVNTDEIGIEVTVANDVSGAKTIRIHNISLMYETSDNTKAVSYFGSGNGDVTLSAASTTNYWCGGNTSNRATTEVQIEVLNTFTLTNLYVTVRSNARTTTTTFKSRINSADGNMSVVYTSGQTGIKEDTSNTDSLISGYVISLSCTTGTGTGNILIEHLWTIINSSSEELKYFELNTSSTGGVNIITTSGYAPIIGGAISAVSENVSQARSGFSFFITNLRAYSSSNTSLDGAYVTLRVEGADTSLSVTYASGETGFKTNTDIVSVSEDYLLGYKNGRGGASGTFTLNQMTCCGFNYSPIVPRTIMF